jgi:peptide/nickel transport system permease protein
VGFSATSRIGHGSDAVTAGAALRQVSRTGSMRQLVWRRFRRHRLAVVGLVILLLLALIAFGVPLFVPEEAANRLVVTEILKPPSAAHPFGTDDVGRDVFLRSIFGGQISLRIGFLAALLSITIGIAVGALAGYNQGWIDNGLMRFTDALLSIPTLFILIVLTQVAGQSIAIITIVIGILSWMGVSRLVRANVLSLKQQDFVLAARAIGTGPGDRVLSRRADPHHRALRQFRRRWAARCVRPPVVAVSGARAAT